jgi:glycosyltransferase involved in cell wall biosynthesis
MKILVAVSSYSLPGEKNSHFFVQVRNMYYKECGRGIEIDVLNFSTKENYVVGGIPVYSLDTYKRELTHKKYDLLVSHQPNIRNHYLFFLKYEKNFQKLVFVFHGHEVLNVNKVYSPPYTYSKQSSFLKKLGRELYDHVKLALWHSYYPRLVYKSHFLFVSKWMYDEFIKWTKISPEEIWDCFSITYNCIGSAFERENYNPKSKKDYDFITIRGNLDGSKYCIDIVNQIAKDNPNFRFLVVGKGSFFEYNEKASNLEWINTHLNHKEIIDYLNLSKCALMPTRTDAQGLMMCEMATFGIPLITSDIPVCFEVFDSFENVRFINNNECEILLKQYFEELQKGVPYKKNSKYFAENTTEKEVHLFEKMILK